MSQTAAWTEAEYHCRQAGLSYEIYKEMYMAIKDRMQKKLEVIQAVRHEQKQNSNYMDYSVKI